MVGIISYGAYIPKYRIKSEEIARVHGGDARFIKKELLIGEKAVPNYDEDSRTLGVEAALNALKKVSIDKKRIGAVYSGSESKVYAVKPNAPIIGEALDIGENYTSADIEFACKAGTAALQMVLGLCKAGFIEYGIAIGTDTAQSAPGDILEYSASAGAASFIVGSKKDEIIADLEMMHSISSDTPDFWRRHNQKYPKHEERFTGEPAYFRHLVKCAKALMEKAKIGVKDIDHFAFHTPNGKFPLKAGKMLNIPIEKLQDNLIVSKVGNTYSAASLLVFTKILDKAKPNETILLTSFGSGAGSDAFLFRITNNIKKLKKTKTTEDYIKNKEYIDYAEYCKSINAI